MNILLIFPGFVVAFVIVFCYKCRIRKTEPRNKVHFYVARDKDSTVSWLYLGKPIRNRVNEFWTPKHRALYNEDSFSDIGINKNVYKDLTWEDEPVEVFLNLKN